MLKRLLILLITGLSLTLSAVEVEQWKWGFDGTMVENDINPLSVMISNPMPVPFDGIITLRKQDSMGGPLGAPLVKKVFLGPYASRWIQFYPYVIDNYEEWRLQWGKKPSQRTSLKVPPKGGKAIVYLTSDSPLLRKNRINIPFFQENLFPPSVGATSGLVGVVIDRPPEFTPLQKQAFSDWLYAGGKVHIIKGPNGLFPKFGSDYSFLDCSGQKTQAGAGEVIKVPGNSVLNSVNLGAPAKIPTDENRIYMQDTEESFFRKLRSQLKTNHNWGLIFLISIIYGILVTVVNYIVGRKSRKTWKPIAFFLGTVIIFSLLLAWCGKRGYGEKSQILSLTYAKELDPNHFALTQWMDIFVTEGDYYKITHKDKTNIYSDCQSMNPINGEIYNGTDGLFMVDIPLFSSMQLFHKGDARTTKPTGITAKYKFDGSDLEFLNITFSKDFPQEILEVKAVAHNNIYNFSKDKVWNKYKLRGSNSFSTHLREWQNNSGYYGFYNQEEDPKKIFKSTITTLILRSRGGDTVVDEYYPKPCATDDKIDIYVMAKTPEAFKTDRQVIKKEEGYTLFHFVLP